MQEKVISIIQAMIAKGLMMITGNYISGLAFPYGPTLSNADCALIFPREDLWVREGKILNPEKLFFDEEGYADHQVDCEGKILAPGFIDVQINGEIFHPSIYFP